MNIQNKISLLQKSLPKGVTLVAVSKTQPVEAIMEAYNAGQRIFGESRPQELCAKYETLPRDIEWHQIGHLQTNKVKYIAPFVAMIQSVDSARLMQTIDNEAQKLNRTIDVLLEIHIAQEQTKQGWDYAELCSWIESGEYRRMSAVRFRGVMAIATYTDDRELTATEFDTLRRMFTELKSNHFDSSFDTISMGMSSDYDLAIERGSTMIRVGSALFR